MDVLKRICDKGKTVLAGPTAKQQLLITRNMIKDCSRTYHLLALFLQTKKDPVGLATEYNKSLWGSSVISLTDALPLLITPFHHYEDSKRRERNFDCDC